MKPRFLFLMKESFIPVMLILICLVVVLIYAEFESSSIANQIVVINIEDNSQNLDDSDEIADFDAETSVSGGPISMDPRIDKAKKLAVEGQLDAAVEVYKSLLAESPTSQNHAEFAAFYLRSNQLEKAKIQIDIATSMSPVHANAFAYRGLLEIKNGNATAAIDDYQKAISLLPYHFQANYNLGLIYYREKKYADAAKLFETAASSAAAQSKAKALFNLALAYKHIGESKILPARKALAKAIRLRPDYIQARFALAGLQADDDNGRREALHQLDKILSLRPNYSPALFRKATVFNAMGNKSEAIANYHSAIKINPNYAKAHFNLGILYLDENKLDLAQSEFDRVIELEPDNATALFQRGKVAYARKNYTLAITYYEKAVDMRKGNYPKALLNIGLCYTKKGNLDQALAAYRAAIKLDNSYPIAWYDLGLALQKSDNLDQAEQAFLTAIKLKPDYSQAWFGLGSLHAKLNQNEKSIEAYLKAIESRPNYRKAQLNLAVRYSITGQFDKAIRLYQQVLDQDPSYALAWINLGIAHFKQNNFDAAEHELQRGLDLDPENISALNYMALVEAEKNNYARAIELLNVAVSQKENDLPLRLALANILYQSGRHKEARFEIEKALKLDPTNSDAIQLLSTVSKPIQ